MPIEVDSDAPLPDKAAREISSIGFPYFDLDEAIKVARVMQDVGGGVAMDRDQVSAALNLAGGTFSNKLSAAKQFGLIDSQQGKWSLTALGYDILDPARERAAKAASFLSVELYKKAFDEFRGRILPSKGGLEHAFTTFGVAQKQKEKARQTFERSARSAGFFPNGSEDRLVAPVIGVSVSTSPEPSPAADVAGGRVVETAAPVRTVAPALGVPPFMTWLLDALPDQGAEWDKAAQADWLQAVAQAFRVVFRSDSSETIVVAVKKAGSAS